MKDQISRALELNEKLHCYTEAVKRKQKSITSEQRQKLIQWIEAANKLSDQEKIQEVEVNFAVLAITVRIMRIPDPT